MTDSDVAVPVTNSESSLHFIFAAPRSGTTWLMRALNQHPEILAVEQRLFGNFCELWPDTDGTHRARQTWDYVLQNFCHYYAESHIGPTATGSEKLEFQAEFAAAFYDHLLRFGLQRSGKQIVIDKVTPYLGTAGKVLSSIAQHFPSAKIIYLIRDGRDVATSGAFDWLARRERTSAAYQYFVEQSRQSFPERLFADDFLTQWCQYWKEPAAALDYRVRQGQFVDQVLTVRYEEMLADQASVLQTICSFLNLDASPEICQRCSAAVTFEKTTARPAGQAIATAKARKGIRGDWRNYFTRNDARLFQDLCGHWLYAYGYAPHSKWVEQCPETLSDHSAADHSAADHSAD